MPAKPNPDLKLVTGDHVADACTKLEVSVLFQHQMQ